MREGARGGWVNDSLNWSGLDSWHVQSGEYRADHLALVRELYAVHRAREGRAYYYSSGADKTLDLGGCDSVQLWSLLEEAARLGLKLVHAQPGLGEVRCHQQGELLIDVTREGDRGSLVSAVLQVDGEDADGLEPLLFMGSSGHGLVCAERDDEETGADAIHGPERRRMALVRLVRPAPAPLRRMILERRAAADPGKRARALRRRAVSRAAQRRHGGVVGRLLHAAGDLRAHARAARKLRRRPCRRGRMGVGLPGRRRHTARGARQQRGRPRVSRPRRPSARSSRPPTSPGRASSASACSTAPGGPPARTLSRSHSRASTACA